MVQLTNSTILNAFQHTNAVYDRELVLRGYNFVLIENLGATLDQFDSIDFSDNDIRSLDGFPLLYRLKSLYFSNNRIIRVVKGIEESLPNLTDLILTNNLIDTFTDVDQLANLKKLRTLSLIRNPINNHRYYRKYVIYKLRHLKILDFQKISAAERKEADGLFNENGGSLAKSEKDKYYMKTTIESQQLLDNAISNTKSIQEIDQLNAKLSAGTY
ncbi:hypothetical protein A3Q56_02318 [Intoshia linei]|uniref:Uncharacterized protein n=1 Tax=Intoshia linei TaxID=1819745 RepID=A0A177B6R1_9BILA|nr:hypothetical protein A3Q56_02318 [Intoshia linei]